MFSFHLIFFSGTRPSVEPIEGPYPTVITQESGRKVLIVQAYAWGKYMGFMNVTFDDKFEVKTWSGQPVLLDNSIPQGKMDKNVWMLL
jgi:5'-nucleotidase